MTREYGTLIGSEITKDIYDRIKRLEEILLCGECDGTGKHEYATFGGIRQCHYCGGTGHKLAILEKLND